MIISIENQLDEPLEIGFPIQLTLAANGSAGDSVELGVTMRDLLHGEEKGDAAYLRLNQLKQNGSITMSIAADGDTDDILEAAMQI